MAPHVGFDTDQIRDKARKDLLHLLEGVSKAYLSVPVRTETEGPLTLVARFEGRRT